MCKNYCNVSHTQFLQGTSNRIVHVLQIIYSSRENLLEQNLKQTPSSSHTAHRLMLWTALVVASMPHHSYVHHVGALISGHDVSTAAQNITMLEAEAVCSKLPGCLGFTFRGPAPTMNSTMLSKVFFKAERNMNSDTSWSTYLRDAPQDKFDCKMRQLAYKFGKQLLPRLGDFEPLYYALGLNVPCDETAPALSAALMEQEIHVEQEDRRVPPLPSAGSLPAHTIFVHPVKGYDGAPGSHDAPVRSLQVACDRAAAQPREHRLVALYGGVHYLRTTLKLGSQHSGLKLRAVPGEEQSPVISGGVRLKVDWTKHRTKGQGVWASDGIYVADLRGQVEDVPGLQLNGTRATRARYPNLPAGIEASCGYGCMIPGDAAMWTPPQFSKFGKTTYHTDMAPNHTRNDSSNGWFQHYMIGIGGLCSVCA